MRRHNWNALRAARRGPTGSPLRRSGAELLELGLVLALLLVLVFGTIEFGTYFYVEHNLQSAAREGARAACVYPHDAANDPLAFAAYTDAYRKVLSQSSLWNWSGFQTALQPSLEWVEDPLHNTPPNVQYYAKVTVAITWDKIPSGMRPMRVITNPQNVTLKGAAMLRVEQ